MSHLPRLPAEPAIGYAHTVGDCVRGDAVYRVVLGDRGAGAGRREGRLRDRAVADRRHRAPPAGQPRGGVVARRGERRVVSATWRLSVDDAMLRWRILGILHENNDEAVAGGARDGARGWGKPRGGGWGRRRRE